MEPETLSRYETGDRALSLSTLAAIADALEVRLGDLLDIERDLPRPLHEHPEHTELVRLFNQASPQRQQIILSLARELARG